MIKIRPKDRTQVLKLAEQSFSTRVELWAYGSRVDGSAHDGSDLDLVVRGQELKEVDISELLTFQEKLRQSQIPILIQVLDWARIPESFHHNILENYEPL